MKRLTPLPVLFLLGAVVTGCTLGPRYKRPDVPAAPDFRGTDNTPVADASSIADQKWFDVFHDPDLQRLIREALQSNFDLRIAAQHALEQQAQVGVTRSQQFPTVTVGGSAVGARLGSAVASSLNSPETAAAGGFTLSAAWTPDFWGLYRRQTEAARAQFLAQQWAQKAVISTLVANIATAYIQLRTLDHELATTRETLRVRRESLQLTERLESGGSATLSDVREAQALVYTASSNIPALEQQIQQQENEISLLLGRKPGPVVRSESYTPTQNVGAVPAGIPSQLLERRPDIQEAEAILIAANANIGVARAQFFPSLPISANGGVGSNAFNSLFDASGGLVYGMGTLTQPLFVGGRLRNNLRLAKATDQEMVITYQKAIDTAFRDVSNALIAYRKTRDYREEQQGLVAADEDATRLAELRYQAGSTAYLEVLTNEANRYAAQLSLASAQQSEALSLVQLYNALGGGWQP
jgi:outer membrane protein, multidrug efflux system